MSAQTGSNTIVRAWPIASLAHMHEHLDRATARRTPSRVEQMIGYSNELLQIDLPCGESLMVKRSQHEWSGTRFRASEIACGLLRRRTGVVVPRHVELQEDARGTPIEVYWRIPLPTLRDLWRELGSHRRPQALRSWGTLLRRVHKVKLAGHGALGADARRALADVLSDDLHERLERAIGDSWPSARDLPARLARHIPELSARCALRPVSLVHNDFHMGNVLCERRARSIRCVGVIDFEAAWAGPPEADIAVVQVLHGPEFGNPLGQRWLEVFLRGYGADASLDSVVLAFFRALHRLNLGYFAALSGWSEHAEDLRRGVLSELELLRRPPDHRVLPSSTAASPST